MALFKRIALSIMAASTVAALTLAAAAPAGAQAQGSSLYTFGDSFLDIGRTCQAGFPAASGGSCSNRNNIPRSLAILDGFNVTGYPGGTSFAVGGSDSFPDTSSNLGVAPNLFSQVAEFAATGRRFAPHDFVMLDFGQNDPVGVPTGPALGVPLANAVASNVQANVSQLVGLGARNFLLFGGSDFNSVLGQFGLNSVSGVSTNNPAFQTFYSALQTAVPNAVAQVINPSVNVYYLDTNTLFRRVLGNPGQFGFLPGDCLVIPSCQTSNSLAVQNQYAFYQAHPTDALNAIIARYFNVILNGPSTVVPQADIGEAVGLSFNKTLMNRLDAYRSLNAPTAETGPYAAYTKAAARTNTAPVSPGSPLSVFVEGLYAGIDRGPAPAFGSSSESTGLAGLTAGLEYRVMPSLVVGAAFNYFNSRTDFGSNYRSKINVEAFQGAGFTSLNYRNFFADAALTYGTINYDLQRPGAVGDVITASPRGDVFTAGGKVGYLFDFPSFRIGPIAEMSYANLRIGAYQENGDPLVTMGVQQQNLEGLTAGAGVQARATLPVFGKVINPFLNVTAEHDFLDQVRAITTFQTSAPVLLIHTTANQSSSDIYGKVAGGFSVDFGKGWNGVMSGSATLGRPGGDDFAANVGIRYRL